MVKNLSLWRKFLICILSVLMLTTLTFGVVTITAKADAYTSEQFQSFLQYTRVTAENGQDAYVITGFDYIAGKNETRKFGESESNPVVIPASYARPGEDALPVIGIAQGVFAGYPLQYVKFEQIERKPGVNDAIFEKLSKFVLADDEKDGWSFKMTGADYGTAMLSIGGYDIDGTKLSDDIINGDAEFRSGVFQGCQDLKTVVLPGTVQEMGPAIFNQSTVEYVKSTTTLGGLKVNGHSFTVFGSMQGLLFLKRIPYRAFYYSQKLTTLVFPDYAEAAESRFVRANYNKDDKINGENLFHAHEEDGNYYFVPMYGGSGVADRTDSNNGVTTNHVLKTLNEHAGLKELGEEAFYNTTAIANTALTSNAVEGFYDIDTNKIKPKRLYFAGITKMGGESMQKVSSVDYDMGKYVAPGTVEGIPGGDISVGRVAWSPYAPYYASYNHSNARYVVNASTGKVSGFHVQWTTSDYSKSQGFSDPDDTINIPSSVSSFTRINDVYGNEIEGEQPTVTITGISGGAFAGITATNGAGKTLTFANGIEMTEIGASTFRANKYITTINNLPDTIEKIAYHAFEQSTITKVTTSSTSGVDSSVINDSTFIMPLNIKQIDHRAFRSATSLQRIYFPGIGDNGTFDINATAFTESPKITQMRFAGWDGSFYQRIIPNEIKNWPWSANEAVMYYNSNTSGYSWTKLVAAKRQDSTGIWDVYYNPANPGEAYLMGVNWNTLKTAATTPSNTYYSQASTWYKKRDLNADFYKGINTAVLSGNDYDLTLPETLTVDNHKVNITGIGAPQGDINFFEDDTNVKINKLTIPKYAREVTTATFRADKISDGGSNPLSINIVVFDWDTYDEENTGVQYIRTSAFGGNASSKTANGSQIKYLYLPEYSLKKIERTAFYGHNLQQKTLVIPGNAESIDPTAFNTLYSHKVEKIYVMQYSTTPSDGSYNLMAGKYNNNGLNGAGSMGLKVGGNAIPVYFVDQFRPVYYEIGQVDGVWQALVAPKLSQDNPGAYDLPYITDGATPQYVHPMLDASGNFTGEVEIRFGVRLLLQHDMGRVSAVDSLNSSGELKKEQQTAGDNSDDPSWGTDFYFVHLEGITKNGTYNFRVEFRNEDLVKALDENRFHYYTGLKFVNEFSIDVNAFSEVVFSHALSMDYNDNALLPKNQTSDGRVALYSGYSYAYKQEGNVYRRDSANTKSVASKIHLDEPLVGDFSNKEYAEFIGWTTDINTAGALQLGYPAEYTPENPTGTFFYAGQTAGESGAGYPLEVLLGENNTTNIGRLYSVFRYVINNGAEVNAVDETLSWIYGENPLTSGYVGTSGDTKGDRLTWPRDSVTVGTLTLVKIEDNGTRTPVKEITVGLGDFNNALGLALNAGLPVGTYQLYGGKREVTRAIANSKTIDGLSPITARFKVVKLEITASGQQVSEVYGDHNVSNATAFVAAGITILPTTTYSGRVSVVPDDHDKILGLTIQGNGFGDVTYPKVGTYTYKYVLKDKDNYILSSNSDNTITYTVTQRPIDINNAGIITDNSDVIQSNSRTYTWEYDGENFKDNQFKSFELSNHMSGDNQSAYKYVWYKVNADGSIGDPIEDAIKDASRIKDAGNYRVYMQWTDYNYIIDSVNRTVFGAASAKGNRIGVGNDDNEKPIYNVIVCDVVITRATLSINITGNTFTYDGDEHGSEVKVSVTAKTDAESFTLTSDQLADISSKYQFTDAGTHTVNYSLSLLIDDTGAYDYLLNYNPVYNATYEVVINVANITVGVDATSSTKEYDGEAFEYDFTYSSTLPDGNTVKYQYYINGAWTAVGATGVTDPVNVGEYIVRVYIVRALDSGTNYNIVATANDDKGAAHGAYYEYSFKITSYDLSKSGRVTAGNKTVDFQAKDMQAEADGFKVVGVGKELAFVEGVATDSKDNNVTLQFSTNGYTWSNTIPVYRNVGTYTIQFIISAPNYADYTGNYTFTINAIAFAQFTNSLTDISATYTATAYGHTSLTFMGIKGDDSNEADTAFTSGLTLVYEYSTDSGDNKTWLTSQTLPTFVNAGTYYVRYTVSHVNYYYVKDGKTYNSGNPYTYTYTITIAKAVLKFTPNVAEYYYNGGLQGNTTFKVEGLVGSDNNTAYVLEFWTTENSTHTTSMPTYRDAGEYTVYYTVADGGNYTCAANCSYKITIKPAEFTVALTSDATAGLLYRGTEFNRAEIILVSATDNGGVIPVFGTDYTVSYKRENSASQNVLNAGSYIATIKINGNNFLISTVQGNETESSLSFIVNQAVVGVEAYTPSFTYNGNAQYSGARFTGTINGLPPTVGSGLLFSSTVKSVYVFNDGYVSTSNTVEGKTLIYTLSLDDNGDYDYTSVGTYTINVTFTDGGNFKFANGTTGYTYQIIPAQVRLNAFNSPVFNNAPQAATIGFNVGNLIKSSDYTVQYQLAEEYGTTAPTNAGTYNVKVTLSNNGNFIFESNNSYEYVQEFTIQQLNIGNLPEGTTIIIELDRTSYTYIGSAITPAIKSYTITFTNGGEAISYEYSATTSNAYSAFVVDYYSNNVNAGNGATVYIVPNANKNTDSNSTNTSANFTGIKSVTFTITQKSLGTATDVSGDIKLNDELISETYLTSTDFLKTLIYRGTSFTLSPTMRYNPGENVAQGTLAEGSDYTVEYYKGTKDASGNWSWTKADNVKDAGTYRAFISAVSGGNYTGNFIVEFTVKASELTAVIDGNAEIVYDAASHKLSVRFSSENAVPTDTAEYKLAYAFASDFFGNDAFGVTANSDGYKNVGTYKIKITLISSNYTWASQTAKDAGFVELTYKITPVTVSVFATNSSYVYDGNEHKSLASFSNTVNGQLPASSAYAIDYSGYTSTAFGNGIDKSDGFKNVGEYTVTVKFGNTTMAGGNFVFGGNGTAESAYVYTATYTYQITPAYIQVASNTATYNGTEQEAALTFTSVSGAIKGTLVKGTDYTVSYTAKNTRGMNGSGSGWTDGASVPTNADTYTVTVTLTNGNYVFQNPTSAEKQNVTNAEYIINPLDIGNELITVTGINANGYGYTGSQITPDITLTTTIETSGKLTSATDYTAAYLNNVNAADATSGLPPTIVLQGQGNYTGTREVKFTITPVSLGSVKVTTAQKTISDGNGGQVTFTEATFENDGGEEHNSKLFTAAQVKSSYLYSGATYVIRSVLSFTPYGIGTAVSQTLSEGVDFTVAYYAQRTINKNTYWVKITASEVKDTGNYRMYLTAMPGNYADGYLIEFKITPAHILLVFEGQDEYKEQTLTYDGHSHQLGVSFVSMDSEGTLPNHTDYSIVYGYEGHFGDTLADSNNFRNAGTYSVTVSFPDGANGHMNFIWEVCSKDGCTCKKDDGLNCHCYDRTITYKIVQAEIDAKLTNETGTYTGSAHDLQNNVTWLTEGGAITPGNLVNAINGVSLDQYKVTRITDAAGNEVSAINVGTYTVTVTLYGGSNTTAGGNFYFKDADGKPVYEKTFTYKITPARIGASAADSTYIYDGSVHKSDVVFSGNVTPDKFDLSAAEWENNTYFVENGLYTLVFSGYLSHYFTTDGTSTVANSDGFKNVGQYTVTVKLLENGNYIFSNGTYEATYTYTITPELVSLAALDSAVYNGQRQVPESSAISFDGTTIATSQYEVSAVSTGTYAFVNVGTYTIKVLFKNTLTNTDEGDYLYGGNYAFRQSGNKYYYSASLSFSITAFTLNGDNTTANWDSCVLCASGSEHTVHEYVYTSLAIEPIKSIVANSTTFTGDKILLDSNGYSISYTNNTNAGTASVTINGYGNFTGLVTLTFKINPKSLTDVKPEGTAGATVTYTGIGDVTYTNTAYSYGALTISYNGRTLREKTHYTVEFYNSKDNTKCSAPVNAGSYYLVVTAVANGNYCDYFWILFTINPALVEVRVSPDNNVYTGLGHDVSDNLIFTNNNGTITPSNSGNAADTYDLSYTATSDNASLDNGKPLTVGNYFVTVTLSGGNFVFGVNGEQVPATTTVYSITPATVTVAAQQSSVIYDGAAHKIGATFTNRLNANVKPASDGEYGLKFSGYESYYFVNSDGESTVTESADFSNVGRYIVTVTLPKDGNFSFGNGVYSSTYTYDITPATVRVQQFASKTYNGQQQGVEGNMNFINTNASGATPIAGTYTIVYNDDARINVGTYNVTVRFNNKLTATNTSFLYGGNFATTQTGADTYTYETVGYSFTINAFELTDVEKSGNTTLYTGNEAWTGADLSATSAVRTYIYSGSAIEPVTVLKVTDNTFVGAANTVGNVLTLNSNEYSLSYYNHTNHGANGSAYVVVRGTGNFTGSFIVYFTIAPYDLGTVSGDNGGMSKDTSGNTEYKNDETLHQSTDPVYVPNLGSINNLVYNGTDRTPTISVQYNGSTIEQAQYTISYQFLYNGEWKDVDAVNGAGTYRIIVTAIEDSVIQTRSLAALAEVTSYTNFTGSFYTTFEVAKATVQVGTNSERTIKYDSSAYKFSYYFIGVDGITFEYGTHYTEAYTYNGSAYGFTEADFDFTNSGTYTLRVTLTAEGEKNFRFATDGDSFTYEIIPSVVTARIQSNTETAYYTGEAQDTRVTFTNSGYKPVSGQYVLSYTQNGNPAIPKNAGEYIVTLTLSSANFRFADGDGYSQSAIIKAVDGTSNYNILPATVTVSLEEYSGDYTGEEHKLAFIFTNPTVNTDELYGYTVTYNDTNNLPKNAGTYAVKVTLTDKNFTFSTDSVILEYTIIPAFVNASLLVEAITYDGNTYDPTTAEGLAALYKGIKFSNDENLLPTDSEYAVTYRYPASETTFRASGDYYVVITLTDGGNFAFSRGSGSSYVYASELLFKINALTIDEYTVVEVKFDENVSLVYTGYELTPDIVTIIVKWYASSSAAEPYRTIVLDSNDYDVDFTNNINVGTARVIVSNIPNFASSITGTFKIVAKSLGSGNYDDDNHGNGDNLTGETYSTAYVYSGSSLEVTPRITYTAYKNDATRPGFILGASDYARYYEMLVNGEWTKVDAVLNAGTYRITIKGTGNYEGIYFLDFTVDRAEISVATTIASVEYIGEDYNLIRYISFNNESGSVTPENSSNGEDFYSIVVTCEEGKGTDVATNARYAGNYVITVTVSSNFKWAEGVGATADGKVQLSFTVTRTQVSVALNRTSDTYIGADYHDRVYAVFTNGTNPSVLPKLDTEYTVTYLKGDGQEEVSILQNATKFKIKVIGTEAGVRNFDISNVTGGVYIGDAILLDYEILPATVRVVWNDSANSYGTEVTLSDNVTFTNASGTYGLVPDKNNVTVYYGTDENNTAITADLNAGVYFVSVIINEGTLDSTNFIFYVTGTNTYYSEVAEGSSYKAVDDKDRLTQTVTPARIWVNEFKSNTYNGAEQPVVIYFYNEHDVEVKLTKDTHYTVSYAQNGKSATPVNAGTYAVTITLNTNEGSEYGNYTFSARAPYGYKLTQNYVINAMELSLSYIVDVTGDGTFDASKETSDESRYFTYFDGKQKTPVPTLEVTLSDGIHELKVDSDYSLDYGDNVHASYSYRMGVLADYTPYIIIVGNGNYVGTLRMPFRIYQANLTFTLENNYGAYTGQTHEVTVKSFSVVDENCKAPSAEEVKDYSVMYYTVVNGQKTASTFSAPLHSGTYYVEITLDEYEGNYYVLSTNNDRGRPALTQEDYAKYAYYVIGQVSLIVTITENEVSYLAMRQSATITLSDASGNGNRLPVLGTDYSVEYTVNTGVSDNDNALLDHELPYNAGKYLVTITLSDTTNYLITKIVVGGTEKSVTTDSITADFIIHRAIVEATVANGVVTGEYDGNEYNLTSRNLLYVAADGVNIYNLFNNPAAKDWYDVTYSAVIVGLSLGETGRPLGAGDYGVQIELSSNFQWGQNEELSGYVSGSRVIARDSDVKATFTFTITPAIVHVEVKGDAIVTYNGTEFNAADYINVYNSGNPDLYPVLDTQADEDEVNTYTVTASDDLLNAGSYTITVTINGGNFVIYIMNGANVSENTYSFTITSASVIVNYSGDSRTYTGTKWDLGDLVFTNTLAQDNPAYATVVPSSSEYELTYNGDFTTVGTHTVTIALLSDNFTFDPTAYSYVGQRVITYTITPATITVNTEDGSWFYGRQGLHGDTLQSAYTVTSSYHPYGEDYEGAYKLIIGAESFKLVDGTAAEVIILDIYRGDGYVVQDQNGNYAFLNVGTSTVMLRINDPNRNHNSVEFEIKVTIVLNAIKITLANDASITDTYGYVRVFDSATVIERFYDQIVGVSGISDFDDEDNSAATLAAKKDWLRDVGLYLNITGDYSGAGYLKAQRYTVGIYLPDANNTVAFSRTGNNQAPGLYVIEQREVVVDWGTYFGDYVYDGTDLNARSNASARAFFNGIVIANALANDKVEFTEKTACYFENGVLEYVVKDVREGGYYLYVESLSGDDAGNYAFENDYRTFNIVRRSAEVNLSSSSSTYGDDYISGFSYSIRDSVLNSDYSDEVVRAFILKLLELRLDGQPINGNPKVGYEYTVTTKDDVVSVDFGDNFTLNFTNVGTHTVSARLLTVGADVSSVYGSGLASVEDIVWSAIGLVEGDTEADLGITFKITQSGSATDGKGVWLKQVGVYSNDIFVGSTYTNLNYNITFVGTYTVNPKTVTIVPADKSYVYGEALPDDLSNWQWSFKDGDGLVDGDDIASLKLSFAYAGLNDNSQHPNVGENIYIRGRIGANSNPNYEVLFETGHIEIIKRNVTIIIGKDHAVYGTLHIGDTINLIHSDDLYINGSWMYADGSYKILSEDLINLVFYLGASQRIPESKFAPVGTYQIIGTFGYSTGNETAINNYELHYEYNFDDKSFEITQATISSGIGVSWTRNDLAYRQGASGIYTDATGWYGMTITPAMYIVLVGDYVIQEDNQFTFTKYVENGSESYIEYQALAGTYNGADQGIIIRYYRPAFTDSDTTVSEGEWYYDASAHIWRVHTIGQWNMQIEVIQANHKTKTFTLTYVIVPVNAVVSLDPVYYVTGKPLQLTYGYDYIKPLGTNNEYTPEQLEALQANALTKELNDYVMGAERMRDSLIFNITGLSDLGGTVDDWYQWIKLYCRIEVVPVSGYINAAGRLIVGTYDLRIVADENCGFNVTFDSGEYDGTNRLVITKAKLSMAWAEEYEEDGTQIVTVTDEDVTYMYTGKGYEQAPQFSGVYANDDVSAPRFEYRLPNGQPIKDPRNVLDNNLTYTIVVFDELSGVDSANYQLPDSRSMVLRIVPRSVTVTIKDGTSIYGEYTDAEIAQHLTDVEAYATASWLGVGDRIESLNIVLTKVEGKNAGDYTISGNYSNGNYNITFINGTYNISPKAVTVTIGKIERTFGDDVANLYEYATAEGVLDGETLKFSLEIEGATYYYLGGYLEVSDNEAGYAIIGHDLDNNYDITFVGDWADGKSGIYKVNKATNEWMQLFLFEYIFEGEEPFALDLPIAKYGPTVIKYYYDEAMTELVEVPVSQLLVGTYYAKACVVETKNFTGLDSVEHVFDIVTDFVPRNRNMEIFAIVVLLTVEVVALTYALIAVRRRKDKNNNLEEGK